MTYRDWSNREQEDPEMAATVMGPVSEDEVRAAIALGERVRDHAERVALRYATLIGLGPSLRWSERQVVHFDDDKARNGFKDGWDPAADYPTEEGFESVWYDRDRDSVYCIVPMRALWDEAATFAEAKERLDEQAALLKAAEVTRMADNKRAVEEAERRELKRLKRKYPKGA